MYVVFGKTAEFCAQHKKNIIGYDVTFADVMEKLAIYYRNTCPLYKIPHTIYAQLKDETALIGKPLFYCSTFADNGECITYQVTQSTARLIWLEAFLENTWVAWKNRPVADKKQDNLSINAFRQRTLVRIFKRQFTETLNNITRCLPRELVITIWNHIEQPFVFEKKY